MRSDNKKEHKILYDIPTIPCTFDQDSRCACSCLDRSIGTFFADWPSKNSAQFGVQLASGMLAFQHEEPGDDVDEGLSVRAIAWTCTKMSEYTGGLSEEE